MGQNSSIEWTEATWNPVTGCSKVSPGCKNCYAERLANRLEAMGQYRYRNNFEVTLQHDLITLPLRWQQPKVIFVNSMSDLFHVDVPNAFITSIFDTMAKAHWHTFQILTKRSERLAELAPSLPWPRNVWMGVSVESPEYVHRIKDLKKVPAAVRFLSVEPLLAPIPTLPVAGIDWIIVGGESGPNCRPMRSEWVQQIRDRCVKHKVSFFFKQWGGVQKKSAGRILDGRTWDELPLSKIRVKSSANHEKGPVLQILA
ncbi:MAG: phage Gp37/Gp68 family protein [Candidatus Manganitrophaceae bacterium]